MNKIAIIISLIVAMAVGVVGCINPSEETAPTIESEAATPSAQSLLPEQRPLIPPRIIGSATLEPFGTDILIEGFGANRAFSEYFNFNEMEEDRYSQELIVDIVMCSDALNHYELREPGHILFELRPCDGHGLWEFSPKKLLYENAQTSKVGQFLYTTEVMGKLRARGDFYKFRLEITNFDPRRQHNVSWEIYVWE